MSNKEITGGELTDVPNDKYRQFFEKFSETETLDVHEWKPVHLIGYFSKKYKQTYNADFKFKFNSPSPAKCFEVFQIKKLASILTARPNLLRDYIDWVFENKIVKPKKRITSISFLTNEDNVKEYKFDVLLAGQKNTNISRTTLLPESYRNAFKVANVSISTYGDLAFLAQMSEMSDELVKAFNEIENCVPQFDKSILSRIV